MHTTTRLQGIYGARLLFFVSARTNKRYHHLSWRIHCGVEVTESSTNRRHTLSPRWLCWQMLVPPQSLQMLLMRSCWQMPVPPQSFQVLLCWLCSHLSGTRWVYSVGLIFVPARTNKRHHHYNPAEPGRPLPLPPPLLLLYCFLLFKEEAV